MRFPSVDSLTPEEFFNQAWVEMSSTYKNHPIFQTVNPYLFHNMRGMRLFSDGGVLLDPTRIEFAVESVRAFGMDVLTSDAVEDFIDWIGAESYSLPPLVSHDLELYAFQKRGINYILEQPSSMLNWDTGTGKTIAGVVLMCERIARGDVDRVVVWCPAHLVRSWESAVKTFSSLSVERVDRGTTNKRVNRISDSDASVLITNYEKVRCKDKDALVGTLPYGRTMFIYDEAQRLKERKTKLHREMVKTKKLLGVKHQLALSATPVEKSPVDYYNLFRLLNPDVFGRVVDFEREYTLYDGNTDMYGRYLGFQNLHDMRMKSDFMVSTARKSDPEIASEFPEMQEIILEIELSPEDERLHSRILSTARSAMREEGDNIGHLFVSAARRCCSLPESLSLSPREDIRGLVSDAEGVSESRHSTKLKATLELVDSITEQGCKVVLFYSLTNHGILLMQRHFDRFSPLVYHGVGMTTAEKDAVIDEFKSSASRNLLMMSNAGREGLNLPEAEYVIHYDTPYLWSHYRQRTDRIHRIDSKKSRVFSYRFLTLGTIEERIEEVMMARRDIACELGVDSEENYEPSVADARYILFGGDESNG